VGEREAGSDGGASWHNLSPNIGGAEIFENKIKWYSTVITMNYIDLKKKTGVLHLNSGVLKPLLHPPNCAYDRGQIGVLNWWKPAARENG
jgi:hypothetical protein